MSRTQRARIAEEAVDIVKRGHYTSHGGKDVTIGPAVDACVAATRFFSAEETERLRADGPGEPRAAAPASIEVTSETTIAAILRLRGTPDIGVLNFASARNPGGGFLGGSQAQEESLARSSALYASLLAAPRYYEQHRESRSALYSGAMIVSPACPVIRDDDGALLDEPMTVNFITSAAPNAGAIAQTQPEDLPRVVPALHRRSEQVLAVAAETSCRTLVLGAWGCGVFRNDPVEVAAAFAHHLRNDGAWSRQFERIVFAVFDMSPQQTNVEAFKRAFFQP